MLVQIINYKYALYKVGGKSSQRAWPTYINIYIKQNNGDR